MEDGASVQSGTVLRFDHGRWLSQDPLGFDAGDSNLYRYVNNFAPMEATDPSGMETRIIEIYYDRSIPSI